MNATTHKTKRQRKVRNNNVGDIAIMELSRYFHGSVLNDDFLDLEAMAMVDDDDNEEGGVYVCY